jgi:RNA polymerase sigma-B factor
MPGQHEVHSPSDRALEDLDAAALAYAGDALEAPAGRRAALRERFARRCLPFANRLARRYRGRGEPLEDLEQVAKLGLVKAIDRYDPDRGSFTAYAVITISGEIKRHFRDKTWGVHVPRRIQDLSLEVAHASMVLTNTSARAPSVDELAAHLGVGEGLVRQAQASAAGYSPASLNAPIIGGDGVAEFGDMIGSPDHDLESVDDKITVATLLLRMPVRERRMLAMRFYGNRTQAEIATELGVSQMHVSRLLSRALTWLRKAMLSDVPPVWEGTSSRPDHHGMQVVASRSDGVLTVRVRGEVDRDTAGRLHVGLRQAVSAAGADPVVIDLTGVPLIDAAGVAVLLDAASAASVAGIGLRIAGAHQYVARILAVSGLAPLMTPPD